VLINNAGISRPSALPDVQLEDFMMLFNVHLLASIPNGIWAENMGLLDDLWVDPLQIADGYITAPERPGHGLRFREEVRREGVVK
jgi:L-alanine-DL-glutamate epimerase-like enolase superfamily enzyme